MSRDVVQVPSHALVAALTMLELVQDRIGSSLHDTEAQMLRVAIARQRECLSYKTAEKYNVAES